MSSGPSIGAMSDLTRIKRARSARASSWDQTGRNEDNWLIMPGESVTLAEIEGPGCITHIWMTQCCRRTPGPGHIPPSETGVPMLEIHNALGVNWEVADPDYYRKILLKFYWDDQEQPSVLTPLGDFFGLMNSLAGNYASTPLTVSVKDVERFVFGGSASFNCYFQMPFGKKARIEVENQNDVPYLQYFYIDYELYDQPLAADVAYFHAKWDRQNPCRGWGPDLQVNSAETRTANLDGKDNYVILDVEGEGHYVGCNLAVRHFQGSWWGEGDDMIFIDDDTWPPSMHGTGGEDYFGHAWGMQHNAFPMCGSIVHESDMPGFQHSFRFHVTDPVRFSKRIRVTMEHGHGNHLADDWSATAYWYQKLPTKPFGILPVEQRLPLRPLDQVTKSAEPVQLNAEQQASKDRAARRMEEFVAARDKVIQRRAEATTRSSAGNLAQAADIRAAFPDKT